MSDSISDPKHDPNRDPNRPVTSSDSPRQPGPAAEETLDTLTPAAADAGAPPSLGATQALNAPANAAFVPGDILAGRFRVIRYIARGGMGEVYEAEDTELNDHVAVKTARFETVSRFPRNRTLPPRNSIGPQSNPSQRLPHLRRFPPHSALIQQLRSAQ